MLETQYDDATQFNRDTTLPVVVCYHRECLDGFMAAYVMRRLVPKATFIACAYGDTPPAITDSIVFIVDFSFPRAVMEHLIATNGHVWLLDHHKTALEDLEAVPGLHYYISSQQSGAGLAVRFTSTLAPLAIPNDLYDLARYVEDRDLWRWAFPETRSITHALYSYPFTFAAWDDLLVRRDLLQSLAREGETIARVREKDRTALVGTARYLTIHEHRVPVVNCPFMYASEVAHQLVLNEARDTFAATYMDYASGRRFSLRSWERGFDVSAIAQRYGGGGHRNAAGFSVPRDHPLAQV